ncbi:MAG: hypothetical protein A2161_09750 [Candidatus Schekmanbacteria bacterium RBG_13_48_7]|uniref:Glutamyl-tRNA amidotransferase n=1 Tax=Candidatus Schekmanbacteria bacterium RBG_13_48_7 TaxID=1817878 RepID=A0A1F7RP21_9BACT|nr:MAG: hypothetical protein A2161_09750 [Candidatus Schekmanbacteria bacterium RBG_13_48_7]
MVSAVRYGAIAKYASEWELKITDSDVLDVIRKQVKTHKESIESFEKAGRTDLVSREKAQLEILMEFIQAEMSDTDLEKIITRILSTGEKNFGALMSQVMAEVKGKADGARVSGKLKELLLHP